ncbi:MAG TPA: isochorismate synthase [Flexivirga sp.]|uniref:isochorismate synthase n=1 Tax=Flexivirga sp. TaxID=1962927 RepID=UPI002C3F49A2|nr:isochorismate synthase [Flexivirga sp.]HWC24460.1 isochorismate synthase [Flexivirga sp.]
MPLPQSHPALVVRSVRIPDPGDLVSLIPADAEAPVCWLREGDGFVGWGTATAIQTEGTSRFADAEQWWRGVVEDAVVRSQVDLPGAGLIAVGSFAFAAASEAGGVLHVPSIVVGRQHDVAWVTTVSTAAGLSGAPELGASECPDAPRISEVGDGALSGSQWTAAVGAAVERIQSGGLDKVVMARDVVVRSETAIDPRYLLRNLSDAYPNTWTYSVDGLIGATPEMLLRRQKGLVTSRVLAGTIRRTGDDEHDLALAASLARSSKDLEEHEYAVRSVADALSPHCSSMNVPESPFVLHLPNVMHLATDVAGVLHEDVSSLSLAASLHPSAAVCGTPTLAARDLIAELEQMDRGRYAGPVGWLDAAGDGEWGIALRCGELETPSQMRLFAGCGIVAGSEPESELTESDAKLVPMRQALGCGA